MVTVDKEHISRLMLFEAYSEKHQAEEKLRLYKNKYTSPVVASYELLDFKAWDSGELAEPVKNISKFRMSL